MSATSANVSERRVQPPSLAISTVIFALRPSESSGRPTLWLPLVRRIRQPYLGQWALPGGPLAHSESLQDAASRNLLETTGLAPRYLEQLYAFGGLDRSAGQRLVSIVYWALVQPDEAALTRESENVRWFRADRIPRPLRGCLPHAARIRPSAAGFPPPSRTRSCDTLRPMHRRGTWRTPAIC